jgi:hypothetical protein
MGRVIKIKISGRGVGTDAPTADDLLDQVRDYLDIFRGVEAAIAEDGQNAIDWRVVDASKGSPLTLACEAFPRQYAINIDRRTLAVVHRTAEGLAALRERPERPPYFTDEVLAKAEKTFLRVMNGLALSELDYGDDLPPLVVTAAVAVGAAKNTQLALRPTDKPYRELGSVEGITQGVERDGFGRNILYIKNRLTGDAVKCLLAGKALEKVERLIIADVLRSHRVRVLGTIHYRSLGRIFHMEASDVEFLRSRSELPSVDDILDEAFTGGLRSEEYLERLRDGRLS